jgi:hypothetical protein
VLTADAADPLGLVVAALHFWYGQQQTALEIAALAAGLLLALTVIIDHLAEASGARAAPAAERGEAKVDQPPEPG